jgi:hypothetical protein
MMVCLHMLTIENYALVLIFYALVGTLQGIGNAHFDGRVPRGLYSFGYLLCSAIGLVYALLGVLWFGFVPAIYVYLPVLLLWWGGLRFGRLFYPVPDRLMATFVLACAIGVVSIHYRLP